MDMMQHPQNATGKALFRVLYKMHRGLLLVLALSVLGACADRVQGHFACDTLLDAQDRADCRARNKRTFDEYDKTRQSEAATGKSTPMVKEDVVCYTQPKENEKPCNPNSQTPQK